MECSAQRPQQAQGAGQRGSDVCRQSCESSPCFWKRGSDTSLDFLISVYGGLGTLALWPLLHEAGTSWEGKAVWVLRVYALSRSCQTSKGLSRRTVFIFMSSLSVNRQRSSPAGMAPCRVDKLMSYPIMVYANTRLALFDLHREVLTGLHMLAIRSAVLTLGVFGDVLELSDV